MEDFKSNDSRRVLSAIRNIYAGILLLFKHKLQELSPADSDEVLLKTKVVPILDKASNEVIWIGKGKKTVEVQDIQERLSGLGVTGVSWPRLQELQKIRNDIEHYYTKLPDNKMKEAVSNALHLIIEFCEPHLKTLPQDLFEPDCWNLMLSEASIYDTELASCLQNLRSVNWLYDEVELSLQEMNCPTCKSRLIRAANPKATGGSLIFRCSSCQTEAQYSAVVAPAVESAMTAESYWSIRDGGDAVNTRCPSCQNETYIHREGVCVVCFEEPGTSTCTMCGDSLTADEVHYSTVCSYCQYKYDKIMAE